MWCPNACEQQIAYSEKSFRDGLDVSDQTLKGMGRDLATAETVPGVEAPVLAGMDKDQYNATVNKEFGPKLSSAAS
ncbi:MULTISPECIES: hypothetical protein [unclassified Streptomyces]|uniref:hypothetical protein n=1 Tax=unclassified Streptomyces TaxID=2593676 RepID=UPI003333692D